MSTEGRRGTVGGELRRLLLAVPSAGVAVVAGWAVVGTTSWLLDEYLGELRSLVAFYAGNSTVVGFTPWGQVLGPVTAVATVATVVGVVGGGLILVQRYSAVGRAGRSSWRRDGWTALVRLPITVAYLTGTAVVTLVGVALLIVPGLFAAARLLAGIPAVLEGASVTTAARRSLSATAERGLALTVWVGVVLLGAVIVGRLTAVWVALPPAVTVLDFRRR